MKSAQRFCTLVVAALLCAGCSVIHFQKGIEKPTQAVRQNADAKVQTQKFPKAISRYKKFSVAAEQNVELTVYAREQKEARANVLFIHGAGSGAWAWEYFFENAPPDFNLYAMSWRGHFDSSEVADADADDYTNDQRAVYSAIEKRNTLATHIVAHSYGAATAVIQASEIKGVASLSLLSPVVPLNYTFTQRMIIPTLAPPFIRKDNAKGQQLNGTYGGMFLSSKRRDHYFERYASKAYSTEKPGLIAGSGVSTVWQIKLKEAFKKVSAQKIPLLFLSARYDNVIVARRQRELCEELKIEMTSVESGHYLPLDVEAEWVVQKVFEGLLSIKAK